MKNVLKRIKKIVKNNMEWKRKFFKENIKEHKLYLYEKLKIKKYLNQFFKLNGLIMHNYTINNSQTVFKLCISYYIVVKTKFIVNIINYNQKIKLIKKVIKEKKTNLRQKVKNKKRLKLIQNYKKILNVINFKKKNKFQKNSFVKKLLIGIKTFIKKLVVILILQNLNKELSFKLKKAKTYMFKKAMIYLRQDIKYLFFKESINIMLIVINKRKSSKFLSNFICYELYKKTKTKQHVLFLIFLKKILTLFSKTNFYNINGIKIIIKGKLNKKPRTKKYIISTGKIPLNTVNSVVNYDKSTIFSIIGTFGIKIWIFEK